MKKRHIKSSWKFCLFIWKCVIIWFVELALFTSKMLIYFFLALLKEGLQTTFSKAVSTIGIRSIICPCRFWQKNWFLKQKRLNENTMHAFIKADYIIVLLSLCLSVQDVCQLHDSFDEKGEITYFKLVFHSS